MKPVQYIIIGAGQRGTGYATYALEHPELAQVVGVAEPRDYYRSHLETVHSIPSGQVFRDWQDAAKRERFADAVIIATQDTMHVEPALAFLQKGYHVLLEKPMATNEADCRRIAEAARASGSIFAVAHVLRYTSYTQKLKALIESGVIGEVVSIQHLEPVGYWHFAHSFVRGNWRNERESSPILLAKSCHDLDWIRYIMGERCTAISSFGNLKHFRKEAQPAGAADRCLECKIEAQCPYSAQKIYLDQGRRGPLQWPASVVVADPTPERTEDALRTGPYGRCVYACDNDVPDNQVVNMEFENRKTATFTMTAFTEQGNRRTSIFGTRGELYGDGEQIRYVNFLHNQTELVDIPTLDLTGDSPLHTHNGGDYNLMQHFIAAVADNDPSQVLSGLEETFETHLMVFAAERARHEQRVVHL